MKSLPDDPPLVSCLMVTLPVGERLEHVKTSVAAYARQSHPRKELVVVVNGGTAEGRENLVAYLSSLDRQDIRIVERPGSLSLGRLRNIALEEAAGDVTCQWDDDDLYHPDRLSEQLRGLLEGSFEAAYLQDVMQYVPRLRSMYWTNWRNTEVGAHPGTLMARRSAPILYPEKGDQASLGEDLVVALDLKRRGAVGAVADLPHLFIYVSHGANSWDQSHHDMLTAQLAISSGLLLRREARIREGLRPFHLDGAGLSLMGSNGLAFQLDAPTG